MQSVATTGMIAARDPQRHSMTSSFRHRLRHATAEAHARLDAQLGELDLRDRDDYRRFLEANAAALLPLEDALVASRVADYFPDWEQRSRRTAILDDLARVGGAADPLPAPTPPLDAAGVLGTMYVLEGSRLGAKVLLRDVERSPDPIVAEATDYLRHGSEERLWQSFLAQLERHGAALPNETAAADGAARAFDLFARATARMCDPDRSTAA